MSAEPTSAAAATAARQKIATVDFDEAEGRIVFSFIDGQALEILLSQFPEVIVKRATIHGFVQKIRDTYAGVKGDVVLGYQNAKETIDQLLNGDWTIRGEGGDGSGALYIEAIARIKGITLEDARARVAKQSDEWKTLVKKDPNVQRVSAEIKLERAQAAVDAARARGEQVGSQVSLDDLFADAA